MNGFGKFAQFNAPTGTQQTQQFVEDFILRMTPRRGKKWVREEIKPVNLADEVLYTVPAPQNPEPAPQKTAPAAPARTETTGTVFPQESAPMEVIRLSDKKTALPPRFNIAKIREAFILAELISAPVSKRRREP